jgi:hypothetical protein
VTNGRVRFGIVGIHEGTEEVLAASDHRRAPHARDTDRPDSGVSGGALHIHALLNGTL